jgi:hypothetical protein
MYVPSPRAVRGPPARSGVDSFKLGPRKPNGPDRPVVAETTDASNHDAAASAIVSRGMSGGNTFSSWTAVTNGSSSPVAPPEISQFTIRVVASRSETRRCEADMGRCVSSSLRQHTGVSYARTLDVVCDQTASISLPSRYSPSRVPVAEGAEAQAVRVTLARPISSGVRTRDGHAGWGGTGSGVSSFWDLMARPRPLVTTTVPQHATSRVIDRSAADL